MLDLSRWAPPGLRWQTERNVFLGVGAGAVLYSFGFLLRYTEARALLYTQESGVSLLRAGAVMEDFAPLLDRALLGFAVQALCMVVFGVYHYVYHNQGSKSMYLMRRLPNRWELHRRCLTLPLLGILASVVLALLLLVLYYEIYMRCTPEQCLTPGQWQKIWNWRGTI